jgi:hypothetical protein
MNNIGKLILAFLAYLFLQTLLSRFTDFGPIYFVAIYPLFIMTLDSGTSHNRVLLLAFIMGFCVDIFTGQIIGLNSAAILIMSLFQPRILRVVAARKAEMDNFRPGIGTMGFYRFASYLLILMAIYHISFSLIESFSLSFFIYNLPRMGVSYAGNVLLIIILEFGISSTIKK